jgi:hypothetical protein
MATPVLGIVFDKVTSEQQPGCSKSTILLSLGYVSLTVFQKNPIWLVRTCFGSNLVFSNLIRLNSALFYLSASNEFFFLSKLKEGVGANKEISIHHSQSPSHGQNDDFFSAENIFTSIMSQQFDQQKTAEKC